MRTSDPVMVGIGTARENGPDGAPGPTYTVIWLQVQGYVVDMDAEAARLISSALMLAAEHMDQRPAVVGPG